MANKYAKFSKQKENMDRVLERVHSHNGVSCIVKRTHRTERAAIKFLEQNGYPGRPYLCPICGKYHVSTKPERS